ncbi:MAG TPA: MFS transporter [Bacteroidota bacterium]|nr:MFS transporter [Bacteroidota bacterium]
MPEINTHSSTIGRYRWVICALLFFATTINYMDRQVLGILRPVLQQELRWANPQNIDIEYGYITTAFTIAYALGVLFFGRFVDRVGTKIGYSVSVAIWGLSSMAHALAGSSLGLGAARVGLGIGESGNFPSALKTVAEWFPKKERALAAGIFNSGANVGAVLAPFLIPWAIYYFAANPVHPFWQIGFIFTGACDLIWLGVWLLVYKKPSESKKVSKEELAYINSDVDEQALTEESVPMIKLLGYRQTWAFFVGKALSDTPWLFYLFWLPIFLKDKYHVDIKDAVHFALPLIVIYSMTTVGSVGGGWLSSKLIKKGWTVNKARKTTMLCFAIAVLPVVLVTSIDLWPAVILFGIVAAAHQAWSANLLTTPSDMFPKKAVGSVSSIGTMGGFTASALFLSLAGYIINTFRANGNVEHGYFILFALCASFYLIALLLFHLLAPKMEVAKV